MPLHGLFHALGPANWHSHAQLLCKEAVQSLHIGHREAVHHSTAQL